MKKPFFSIAFSLLSLTMFTQQTNPKTTHVNTYQKKNMTVVQAHDRTAPNKTQKDNWESKPNVNPETGKKGTKTPKK